MSESTKAQVTKAQVMYVTDIIDNDVAVLYRDPKDQKLKLGHPYNNQLNLSRGEIALIEIDGKGRISIVDQFKEPGPFEAAVIKRYARSRDIQVAYETTTGHFKMMSIEVSKRRQLPTVGDTVKIKLVPARTDIGSKTNAIYPGWTSQYVIA